MEKWSNSLVGRWWEVFWEPDGDGDGEEHVPEKVGVEQAAKGDNKQPATIAPTEKSAERYTLTYTTPSLGLSLQLNMSTGRIFVSAVGPMAPHSTSIEQNDTIVAIAGKAVQKLNGKEGFGRVVDVLRKEARPVQVTFERSASQKSVGQAIGQAGSGVLKFNEHRSDMAVKSLKAHAIAGEHDLNYPAYPADGLPVGWLQREVPAVGGSLDVSRVRAEKQEVSKPLISHPASGELVQHMGVRSSISAVSGANDSVALAAGIASNMANSSAPLDAATLDTAEVLVNHTSASVAAMASEKNSNTGVELPLAKKAKPTEYKYYSPIMSYKFNSMSDVKRYLACLEIVRERRPGGRTNHNAGENEEVDAMREYQVESVEVPRAQDHVDDLNLSSQQQRKRQHQADEDSSVEDEKKPGQDDAVDWYDARILQYIAPDNDHASGQFVVHFLGDLESTTYTMELGPRIVRASARAWAKRTLKLLYCQVDLWNESDGGRTSNHGQKNIEGTLPPSTDMPADDEPIREMHAGDFGAKDESLSEYRRLLREQHYLATKINAAGDDGEEGDEEDDPANSEDDENGPGPAVNSCFVAHLTNALKENEKAVDFLSKESSTSSTVGNLPLELYAKVSRVMKTSESDQPTSFDKGNLLMFLVNSSQYLYNLLRHEPTREMAVRQQYESNKGRKKRRVQTPTAAIMDSTTFQTLSSNALVSTKALSKLLTPLLANKSTSQRTRKNVNDNQEPAVTSRMVDVVSKLYQLWKSVTDWVDNAEDMVNAISKRVYTFEQVEGMSQSLVTVPLVLFDMSSLSNKLTSKLSRARFFEMEAWSAVKSSTQIPVLGSASAGGEDDCLAALSRLKIEATSGQHMKNIDPLSRCTSSSSGTLSSSLTRAVIDDAIVTRQWVLDLNQAKSHRERITFVQDIIERWNALPSLPTPPFDGLEGGIANLSAALAANTRDSITVLSSSCFSYSHIIGNAEARLLNSTIADNTSEQDARLRSKEGVALALLELTRLPILSVVEEKLHLRHELLDWNNRVKDIMTASAVSKISYSQIENLYRQLMSILALKTDRRIELCQNIKPCTMIEGQMKLFAASEESLICPATSAWARTQFNKSSKWIEGYNDVMDIINSQSNSAPGVSSPPPLSSSTGRLVEVQRIRNLLSEHGELACAFQTSYAELQSMHQAATQWETMIDQVLTTDTLTLSERCQQLTVASQSRPRGIMLDPSCDAIDEWRKLLTWPLDLERGVGELTSKLLSRTASTQLPGEGVEIELMSLVNDCLGQLIVAGKDLNLFQTTTKFLGELKNQVLCSFPSTGQSLNPDAILRTSKHGPKVLGIIHKDSGGSVKAVTSAFWKLLCIKFVDHLKCVGSFANSCDLSDAKALISLCPVGSQSPIDTSADLLKLKKFVSDAERLRNEFSLEIAQASTFLQSNCFENEAGIRTCMLKLKDLQSDFEDPQLALAVILLRHLKCEDSLATMIRKLAWLTDMLAHGGVFDDNAHAPSDDGGRIHICELKKLHDSIPLAIDSEKTAPAGVAADSELLRMCIQVKRTFDRARLWQQRVGAVLKDTNSGDDVMTLDGLAAIAMDPILSKVILPEHESIKDVMANANQLRERLYEELFTHEYAGNSIDVNNTQLPDGSSLIAENREFVLYRFTGSQMYHKLSAKLRSLNDIAKGLTALTPEKACLKWMTKLHGWLERMQASLSQSGHLFVIKIEQALTLLEEGHSALFSLYDEVQSLLRQAKISVHVNPQGISVLSMKGGLQTLGLCFLRWVAILYDCLNSDVEREDAWKTEVFRLSSMFSSYETESVVPGGSVLNTVFRGADRFYDTAQGLAKELNELIIHDSDIESSLSKLRTKMTENEPFQRSLKAELIAAEERQFLLENEEFEYPNRFNLLDSLMDNVPSIQEYDVDENDYDQMIPGEESVRDKSRNFIEKSILTGIETMGFCQDDTEARDFCSLLAWKIEDHCFNVYHSDPTASISPEYKNKVRSLRFNLQDPKNPSLCARVIVGDMSIDELIDASAEDLASSALKEKRQAVHQKAIKNVVLVGEHSKDPPAMSSDLASKIRMIESMSGKKRSDLGGQESIVGHTDPNNGEEEEDDDDVSVGQDKEESPTISIPHGAAQPNAVLASLAPPPMQKNSRDSWGAYDPSSVPQSGEYIKSKTGSDQFRITISKLKLSFMTKISTVASCRYNLDRILPSTLVEKGRLPVDEFSKFVHEKTKSGKSVLAFLRLSSMSDNEMESYKRFYKQYEAIGRITMMTVSNETKCFLVTPKFQRSLLKYLTDDSLSKTSSYVVVLTKQTLPMK